MPSIRTKQEARDRIAHLRRELVEHDRFREDTQDTMQRTVDFRHDWPSLYRDINIKIRDEISQLKDLMDTLPEE